MAGDDRAADLMHCYIDERVDKEQRSRMVTAEMS